jgi:two-component system, response regulator PdtaR
MKDAHSVDFADGLLAAEAERGSAVNASARGARRVLIVEDNYFVAHQCAGALSAAGFEIVGIVPTGEEAVAVATAERPNLVLMDIYLAGKRDGIDAATEILERFGIRSIFASAFGDTAMRERAQRAEPLGWLPKPFSDVKLVAAVEGAIKHNEAHPLAPR